MDGMLISIIVFLAVYVAITFELINKAVATFSGVAILILLNVIDEQVFRDPPHRVPNRSGASQNRLCPLSQLL